MTNENRTPKICKTCGESNCLRIHISDAAEPGPMSIPTNTNLEKTPILPYTLEQLRDWLQRYANDVGKNEMYDNPEFLLDDLSKDIAGLREGKIDLRCLQMHYPCNDPENGPACPCTLSEGHEGKHWRETYG